MSLNKSAEEFKKLASNFKSILELAGELEKLGNVEAAVAKANKLSEEASKGLEKSKADLNVALAKVSEAEINAQLIVKNAEEKAYSIVSGAKVQAAEIQKDGQEKKAHLEEKIVEANAELQAVREQVRSEKLELVLVQDEINGLKQKVSALAR